MKKVAWFGTHPVQYHSPMFTEIHQNQDIDLVVYYFSDFSVKGYQDKEFGQTVKWDVPLLEGYKSKILKNYIKKSHGSFFSYINVGICQEIKNNNFNLVITHGWSTFSHILVFLTCIMTSTPYALRGDTNSFGESDRKGFKQKIRRWFLKTIFNKASAIFYIGEQNKKFYQYFDVPEQKMYKMPFAVNNNFFSQYAKNLDFSKEKELLHIQTNQKIILFSGKLVAIKQVDVLIEALSGISIDDYVLLVVGDGEEKDRLERLANRLNVNIRFLGFINQKEIPTYYWLSDIFVLPSKKEAWGLSINEAMNCECAIVVSDQVGAKDDLIQDNGFVFKSGSVEDLRNKIEFLLLDNEKLERCKQKSLEIIQNYSYNVDAKSIKKYFEVIR